MGISISDAVQAGNRRPSSPRSPQQTAPTRLPAYLYQSPYGYIFRMRIPPDLKDLIGKVEYRYSLRTGSLKDARHRARLLASNIQQLFMDVREGTFRFTSGDAFNSRVKQYAREAVSSPSRTASSPPIHGGLSSGDNEGVIPADQYASMLNLLKQALREHFSQGIGQAQLVDSKLVVGEPKTVGNEVRSTSCNCGSSTKEAMDNQAAAGSQMHPGGAVSQDDHGQQPSKLESRRLLEQEKRLKTVVHQELQPPQHPVCWQQTAPAHGNQGTLFSELVRLYTKEMVKGGNWTEKTASENQTVFALFTRAMGDLPVTSMDRKVVSQYKGILAQLPPHLNMLPQYKGKSLGEIIASQESLPPQARKSLSVNSINKHIHWLSGLFTYGVNNGYMTYNAASGLLLKNPKRADQQREVYTQEDLIKLFGSEEHRKATNHEYWVPLIALYSGCRLEEICQLHLEDIRLAKPVGQESGVWVLDINGKHEKRLKNLSSTRLVPIHPRLIELGLLEYADKLRAKREQRLFPFLHQRRDGYGQVVSKWFGRFRKRCGIEDGKTFHSFRHTFITHLKHKQVDPFMIHELDGHSINSETMGRYGKRYTPEILLNEAILKVDYGLIAIPLL